MSAGKFVTEIDKLAGDGALDGERMARITKFWPAPWRFEDEGYSEGPCVKSADGQVICAFFWPGHPVEATNEAEQTLYALARMITALGNK